MVFSSHSIGEWRERLRRGFFSEAETKWKEVALLISLYRTTQLLVFASLDGGVVQVILKDKGQKAPKDERRSQKIK
jgi:hypothetical protein